MKRLLTLEEIDYITSDIQPQNCLTGEHLHHMMIQKLKTNLIHIKVYPETIEQLKNEITRHWYSSQVQPGDTVGITTAQSIGERQTQLALDSFHSTGITTLTVVAGVPRFTELVNATKNPKNVLTTIYCNNSYHSMESIRDEVGRNIQHIDLNSIMIRHYTFVCSADTKRPLWYKLYEKFVRELPNSSTFIRIYLNRDALFQHHIRPADIAHKLEEFHEIMCVFSPTTEAIIDIYFEVEPTSRVNPYVYVNNSLLPSLKKTTIRGIPNILELNYTQTNDEWHIEALGQNLQKLFGHLLIDETRTISNNMWEMFNVLGTEATREFLVREFLNVISVDAYINKRHVELLVDIMLYTGNIMSITRYGIRRSENGILSASSFEESLDQFLQAGLYGEKDDLTGVSASIICGKLSRNGTGMCDLIYADNS